MDDIDYSLSDRDIRGLFNNQVNVITYDKLFGYRNINDLLGPYNRCVILYKSSASYGHWCCIKRTGTLISFFDSYGGFPDTQKVKNDPEFIRTSGQGFNYICKLLHQASTTNTIEFNEHKYQLARKGINTCGKWCYVFLMFNGGTDDFYEFIMNTKKDLGLPSLDILINYIFISLINNVFIL